MNEEIQDGVYQVSQKEALELAEYGIHLESIEEKKAKLETKEEEK